MSEIPASFRQRYAALQQRFRDELPARLRHIMEAGEKWLADADADTAQVFRQAVHKLAGSAGNYGFAEITRLCQQIEADLQTLDAGARQRIRRHLQQLGEQPR